MRLSNFAAARIRIRLGVAGAIVLLGVVTPVHASSPTPDPIAQAQQNVQNAQNRAAAADSALAQAQANLASSQAQLAAITGQVAALDTKIAAQTAQVAAIQRQLSIDRNLLKAYMLQDYMRGRSGTLDYLLSSTSLTEALNRQANVKAFASAGQDLVGQVNGEKKAADDILTALQSNRSQLANSQAQAAAQEVVIASEESQVSAADTAAHSQLSSAANTLGGLLMAQQISSKPHDTGIVFSPVPGAGFTMDTDLTKPSGLNADTINRFLAGSDEAGLGAAFMNAERTFHVSARYFVAHSILESAFGSSAIAQNKHNLFGYGADDANPYGDAVNFATFADCINFVAHQVEVNYLTSGGAFYHGATLRGMNVDYASDPNWAIKIASIANKIPAS